MKRMSQWGGLESPPDEPFEDEHLEDDGAYADDHDYDDLDVQVAERRYEAQQLGLG